MILNLKNKSNLMISLNKNYKKYNLDITVKSKHFNYNVFTKIRYETLITIIENIESMLFSKNRYIENVYFKNLIFEFDQFITNMKIVIKINKNEEYSIKLDRENVIKLYNYITNYLKIFNKLQAIDFNRKYTYVQVRYIDVYSPKTYSYISEDKSIKPGDIVYVDRAGKKCLAVVENKNEYYYEQVPYPILETKRVISIATRAKKYRF